MKKRGNFAALTLLLCLFQSMAMAQFASVQEPVLPPSAQFSVPAPQSVLLPQQDNAALIAEDVAEIESARLAGETVPFRSAVPLPVNWNPSNSGSWETLPDGTRIWRLRIESPGATDLCLHFNGWWLVKPCEVFYYNDDLSDVAGPFTYIDNWDGTNISPFITGSAVTLEYVVPADVQDTGELSIMSVLHGYRHMFNRAARERDALDNFGDSEACNVNVNCLGYMQEEKRAVAMIFDPSVGRWCSGTLLNNTLQNGDPLFLTADHCLNGNHTNWQFAFNYESAACSPTTDGSTNDVVFNATLLSNWLNSDFALLRLSRPRPNSPYIPAFMGWDRGGVAPSSTYGIHHPNGDVKKGSEDFNPPTSSDWNGNFPNTHWSVSWDNGITAGGSSGSALIANSGRVIGQLHGGLSFCATPQAADKYGKLSTSWDGGGNQSTRLRDWLDPNSSGSQVGNYWQPQSPPNDSCGQPGFTNITSLPFSTSGSTQFAANNVNFTGSCNTNTSPEVFYSLQLPCDHQVTVSTCGSSFDTQLFIYGASSCGVSGFLVDCNDDFCGTQSQVTFTATGGQLYMIALEGYASAWGNFVLNITGTSSGAQGNAQCPGYAITEVPYFTYGATWCGNDDVNPTCQSNDGQDVHWYWVSPYNQAMRARTCYINFDTILEVKYGGACPGTWSAGCNDDYFCGSDAFASTVVFNANAGATYYVHMDGYNGAEGMASLELEVYNDDCESPIVVPSLPANYQGDTRPATDNFATIVGPSSKEVFFQYTSLTCQTIQIHTCDENYTNFDTGIEVRTGGPCPGSTVVTWNDDACGSDGLKSSVLFNAEANRTYYIIVSGYNNAAGQFMIYFSGGASQGAPVGDVCETALQIPSLPFTDNGNTCCMADNYTPCVGPDSREVVYNYFSQDCQNVTVSLCGSNYDTGLGIYGGTCPNIAPLIVCNDDNYCGDTYVVQSTATFTAEANTNYQFLIHGYSTNCGNYALNVTGVPCPPPVVIAPDSLTIHIDPTSATAELRWASVENANTYWVYRSLTPDNIVSPANLIAGVNTNSFNCAGCVSQADERVFFAVTAEYVPAIASESGETVELAANRLTKADAQQSPIIENPHVNMTNEIEEQAYKNGK
jgi:hypothetical protein